AITAGSAALPGSINIAPSSSINLTPSNVTLGTSLNASGGTNNAFNLMGADFYLDNGKSVLFKDSGGTYQRPFDSSRDNIRLLSKVDVFLVPGSNATAAGNVVVNTSRGAFILPKLTKAQRGALTPQDGMMIYQTDSTPGAREYRNGAWGILSWTADP